MYLPSISVSSFWIPDRTRRCLLHPQWSLQKRWPERIVSPLPRHLLSLFCFQPTQILLQFLMTTNIYNCWFAATTIPDILISVWTKTKIKKNNDWMRECTLLILNINYWVFCWWTFKEFLSQSDSPSFNQPCECLMQFSEDVLVSCKLNEGPGRFRLSDRACQVSMMFHYSCWVDPLTSSRTFGLFSFIHFQGFCLQVINDALHVFHEEWPRIEQEYFIHHHYDYAVSALEPSRVLTVFENEHMTENITTVFISEEYRTWTLLSRWRLKVRILV